MKYLVNVNTKQILKEAKSIGQDWVDTQLNLEFLELEDAVLEDGSFRQLTDEDINPVINKALIKEIVQLENSLLRPIRELLSTSSTQEQKNVAQVKIDQVEEQIQNLRSRMI